MIEYKIVKSKSELNPEVYTYGINAICDGCVEVSIEDISLDVEYVKALEQLCNSTDLSPIHLKDVVEDFLAK